MYSHYIQILLRLLFLLAIICFTGIIVFFSIKYAYPFIIGLGLAFFINPIVNFFQEKLRFSRWLSVIFVLFTSLGFTFGLITIFISEMIMGTNYLSQSVPYHFQSLVFTFQDLLTEKIMPIYQKISLLFYSLETDYQATILTYIETVTLQLTSTISLTIQSILTSVSEFLLSLPNLASVFIFSLLATFFISKDWYKLVLILRKSLPKELVERTKDVMISLKKAFIGFIFAQITLISITCLIVLVGLLILRVEYPITVALSIAIVDLLPYLGTGLIFIPWILFTFFSGQFSLTIGLSILYAIVIVQRQIMEPKILSSSIGVDPLATLVSLFVGYKLFGFLGLIIGPIILIFIQTLSNAHVFRDLYSFLLKKG